MSEYIVEFDELVSNAELENKDKLINKLQDQNARLIDAVCQLAKAAAHVK